MRLFSFILVLFALNACSNGNAGQLFENYLWKNRLILVYAPTPDDGRLAEQKAILDAAQEDLNGRDIIRWEFVYLETVRKNGVQKPHLSTNPFYKEHDIERTAFAVLLIGKDGEVKMKQDTPISAQTLFDTIDAMPMRQREMQQPPS